MKHASASFPAIIVLSAMLSFITAFAQEKPQSVPSMGDLQIVVVGFQSATGNVKIALSNSEANYASKSQAFRGVSANIENDKATTVFANLPYGEYAVRVYHDANGNDNLDTNFMGIPKEPYGFSNNVRGTFGPAKWEKAKFEFRSEHLTIEIRVK
jgi:uncharacterized protein (DUF2141 family)